MRTENVIASQACVMGDGLRVCSKWYWRVMMPACRTCMAHSTTTAGCFRDQVKQEKVFVEAQQRRDEALAKCMAAEVSDLPVPKPVVPSMEIDSDAAAGKAKRKKHHKFLLPTPKSTVDEDEEMADGSTAVPVRKSRRWVTSFSVYMTSHLQNTAWFWMWAQRGALNRMTQAFMVC